VTGPAWKPPARSEKSFSITAVPAGPVLAWELQLLAAARASESDVDLVRSRRGQFHQSVRFRVAAYLPIELRREARLGRRATLNVGDGCGDQDSFRVFMRACLLRAQSGPSDPSSHCSKSSNKIVDIIRLFSSFRRWHIASVSAEMERATD